MSDGLSNGGFAVTTLSWSACKPTMWIPIIQVLCPMESITWKEITQKPFTHDLIAWELFTALAWEPITIYTLETFKNLPLHDLNLIACLQHALYPHQHFYRR